LHKNCPCSCRHLCPKLSEGRPAAFDVTCVHPLQQKYVTASSKTNNHTNNCTEDLKRKKYQSECEANGVDFIPLSIEFYGGWGKSAMCLFSKLANSISGGVRRERISIIQEIYRRTSKIMVKYNSRALMIRNGGLMAK